jgi:RNA polymerase sigma-B factor
MDRDDLIVRHMPMAREMARAHPLGGRDREDVEGEALLGLCRAAAEHDPAAFPDTPFAVFARHHIRKALNESLEAADSIRLPVRLKRAAAQFAAAAEALLAAGVTRPTAEQLAGAAGLSVEAARDYLAVPHVAGPVESLGDHAGDERRDPEQERLLAEVEEVLDRCTDLGRSVLTLHRLDGLSLRQVGRRLGLSPAEVRREHHRACRAVAAEMRRRGWTMPSWARAIA